MSADHRRFEMSCALAMSGAASDRELQDLREHVQECCECRVRLSQMAWLSGELTEMATGVLGRSPRVMQDRFRLRAMSEGVTLKRPERALSMSFAVAAVALVLACVMAITLRSRRMEMNAAAVTNADRNDAGAGVLSRGQTLQRVANVSPAARRSSVRWNANSRERTRLFARALSDGKTSPAFESPELHRARWAQSIGDNSFWSADAIAAVQMLEDKPAPWAATPPMRFALLESDAPACGAEALLPRLSDESFGRRPVQRIFCLNRKIARLTLFEPLRLNAANAPPEFDFKDFTFPRVLRASQ